jgi:transposase
MRRASKRVWAERVARWQKSGKSSTEFARKSRPSFHPKTLTYWAWRLRQGSPATVAVASPVEWVEVAPATAPAQRDPFELVVGEGVVVRVPVGFDADALRRLLGVVVGGGQ